MLYARRGLILAFGGSASKTEATLKYGQEQRQNQRGSSFQWAAEQLIQADRIEHGFHG
jgi:hypothetical protein